MTISSQADANATRTCSLCKQEKPILQFYFRKHVGYYESRCKDCLSKINRKYYEKNRASVLVVAKAYRDKNPGRIRTYLGKYSKERGRLMKETVVRHFGGKCACCGESDIGFLTIDHVNNDGGKHRKEIGKAGLYMWLIRHNFPATYELQVLCFNCNFGKNHNGGICPHKSEGSETIRKE